MKEYLYYDIWEDERNLFRISYHTFLAEEKKYRFERNYAPGEESYRQASFLFLELAQKELDQIHYHRNKQEKVDRVTVRYGNKIVCLHNLSRIKSHPTFGIVLDRIRAESVKKKQKLKRRNHYQRILATSLVAISMAGLIGSIIKTDTSIGTSEPDSISISSSSPEIEQPQMEVSRPESTTLMTSSPVANSILSSPATISPSTSEPENDVVDDVERFSNAFHMTVEEALSLFDPDTLPTMSKLEIYDTIKNEYWYGNQFVLDRTPTKEDLTLQEREDLILEMARMYGIEDEDTLLTMIAIFRLETGNGTSELLLEKNNFGGIRGNDGNFLAYPSAMSGSQAFVKTILNRRDERIQAHIYNDQQTLAENISSVYCTELVSDDVTWHGQVDGIVTRLKEEHYLNRTFLNK